MKQAAFLLLSAGLSQRAHADLFAYFRYEDGRTNWQYIANTSASLLILILLVVLGFLIMAHLRARRSNRALTEMKATLEERVAQRTASLEAAAEQLRKREAYIASIVNSMPVMLIGVNEQLQVTQWNKMAEEITGRPFEDVTGEDLWTAYPRISLSKSQVQSVLSTGTTLHLKQTQRDRYSFDITLYRLKHHDDIGLVILISDITKQVNAETKLAERDKLSALGELASGMAHDISLPINAILEHVSRSQQRIEASNLGHEKPVLLREVGIVQQRARQATAIAQNLLDLARSHSGEARSAQIPELMDQGIALATELYDDADGLAFRDIEVRRQYASDLPAIQCYPDELVQVFTRLLRSAYHAIRAVQRDGEAPPRIDVEVGHFFDSVWVKIAHKGQCLVADELVEIFEPFFLSAGEQGSFPVEHRLSYPYFIVTKRHQGHMSVTSDAQLGTCFNIQLAL